MSFESKIPQYIRELDLKIAELSQKRRDLDWGHDCNCENCDDRGEIPEETEELDAELAAQIRDCLNTISSLKGFASIKGVKLEDKS